MAWLIKAPLIKVTDMARIVLILLLQLVLTSLSAQSTVRKYLSGTDKDHTVEWDFFCTKGRNSGVWSKIPVPSCWEMQGFGTYNYGWQENFKENESGLYRYSFTSEPSWKGKRVMIVFEGSMTDTEVKVNGQPAGPKHQGSFYRFKYDVTSLLKDKNLLEVKVDKISADTSVNRAERMSDFWVFGGIYRPVYLEVLPQQFIDWTAIDAKADGSLLINVYAAGLKDATEVEGQVFTMDNKPAGQPFRSAVVRKQDKIVLTTRIENPLPWTPESPNRYKVEIRLRNKRGVIHQVTEKFGFRTVEFREASGFFVNGTKVIFKGVNRHSFWPETGRTTSKEISILDVNLMKDMNMNAVRMSHYPPDVDFLDVCDSLGLFVLDELTGWQKKYDTPVGKKLVREMIIRDVNHPSIVIWDNGNEGGNNHDLVGEYALYDPQNRKVIHPWNIFNGTDTQHYKGYDCCAGSLNHGSNVFFPTEWLHGLYDGGHGAGLDDHWTLMRRNPLFAGLFLWVFADEGVVRADKNNAIDTHGNRAPDGIVGPYREKEGSFYTIKEIWSPVQLTNASYSPEFNGTLEVKNDYLYTPLDKVKLEWQIRKAPLPHTDTTAQVLFRGVTNGPSLAPGRTGYIDLALPRDFRNGDIFSLRATDEYGRHINTWSWPLKRPVATNPVPVTASNAANSTVALATADVVLAAAGVEVTIDKVTGMIKQVKNSAGNISLSAGPTLAAGTSENKGVRYFSEGANKVAEVITGGDLKRLRYTMSKDGVLRMDYAYFFSGRGNMFDNVGISFAYPEEKVTGVTMLAAGPYRVWKNRMKGTQFGVWKKKYNNTVTGESWDYPEFKGFYRAFNWVVIENSESPFLVSTDTDNLFLRLYTPPKPKGAGNDFTSPPFPSGDISFLHGISAIGTKFDPAEAHGPQSQKNRTGSEWTSGTLYFDFRAK